MKFTFAGANGKTNLRESLIIKAESQEICGWGEVCSLPFYGKERISDSFLALKNNLIKLKNSTFSHPFEISLNLPNMAAAAVEMAICDVYARTKNINFLNEIFNGNLDNKTKIKIVFGLQDEKSLTNNIANELANGVSDFKLKATGNNIDLIKKIVCKFNNARFGIDANGSLTLNDLNELEKVGLKYIEQPFKELKSNIALDLKTPICLDESINSLDELKSALRLKACNMVNIKFSRLGGLKKTSEIIKFCEQNGVKFWIGSMLETGIAKAITISLSAHKSCCEAGDVSPIERYFYEDFSDLKTPNKKGFLDIPKGIGFGINVNESVVRKFTKQIYEF